MDAYAEVRLRRCNGQVVKSRIWVLWLTFLTKVVAVAELNFHTTVDRTHFGSSLLLVAFAEISCVRLSRLPDVKFVRSGAQASAKETRGRRTVQNRTLDIERSPTRKAKDTIWFSL